MSENGRPPSENSGTLFAVGDLKIKKSQIAALTTAGGASWTAVAYLLTQIPQVDLLGLRARDELLIECRQSKADRVAELVADRQLVIDRADSRVADCQATCDERVADLRAAIGRLDGRLNQQSETQ